MPVDFDESVTVVLTKKEMLVIEHALGMYLESSDCTVDNGTGKKTKPIFWLVQDLESKFASDGETHDAFLEEILGIKPDNEFGLAACVKKARELGVPSPKIIEFVKQMRQQRRVPELG